MSAVRKALKFSLLPDHVFLAKTQIVLSRNAKTEGWESVNGCYRAPNQSSETFRKL